MRSADTAALQPPYKFPFSSTCSDQFSGSGAERPSTAIHMSALSTSGSRPRYCKARWLPPHSPAAALCSVVHTLAYARTSSSSFAISILAAGCCSFVTTGEPPTAVPAPKDTTALAAEAPGCCPDARDCCFEATSCPRCAAARALCSATSNSDLLATNLSSALSDSSCATRTWAGHVRLWAHRRAQRGTMEEMSSV
jgi:hypothetical protein